jgi:3-phosphoshikimate 1-carboxyvinyltransferase
VKLASTVTALSRFPRRSRKMADSIVIQPVTRSIRATVRPPGSKSITNRALVCAALADGTSTLAGALDSEDTRVMIDGLGRLGIGIEATECSRHTPCAEAVDGRYAEAADGTRSVPATLIVHGAGGEIPALEAELFCANSGTTIRFLTALSTLGHGRFRLDGVERMRQRPIADLLDALNDLGARTASEQSNGCPPVVVHANGLPGGTAKVRGDISSQFLSGVLMAAPAARADVELLIDGRLVSQPYVQMTLAVMRAFAVAVETGAELERFTVNAPQRYLAREYTIEPDASAASYFWAAAAITGGEVTVAGLSSTSVQGDVAFVDCLEKMGCQTRRNADSITVVGGPLRGIDVDMNAISDTVQTLAVVALFADGPTTISNVAHIRHKETDRLAALATELRKLGADVTERQDGLVIQPRNLYPAAIDTYNDHRMAMSFALAALRIAGVQISNPRCVDKTYPGFFEDLLAMLEQSHQ